MGLKCGIVGLPNVGKSTLYNALTKNNIPAENYPFCTIEPNSGIVALPDKRLNRLKKIYNPKKTIPSIIEFTDIAGLVKGASRGEGLGNKFLGHIRQTDAIIQVIRCFDNDKITHVDKNINPIRDIETIQTELLLADLDSLEKQKTKHEKNARGGNKTAIKALNIIKELIKHCNIGKPARTLTNNNENLKIIKTFHLLTMKPTLFIANIDENEILNDDLGTHSEMLFKYANKNKVPVIRICASIEQEISILDDKEKILFLNEYNLSEPGLNKIIKSSFKLLNLHTFFTCGEKELKSWTIPIGTTAPNAAGVIHTDFKKGFIKAEIFHYNDLIKYNSEKKLSELGLIRQEGKQYIIKNGDCIYFKFNV
tara:strand:+ start:323 stop:1423 length:1101 start_codon:yes stop_codon:yes gene_type:complete